MHRRLDQDRTPHANAEDEGSNPSRRSIIICAWYTPDYKPWAERLRANLDALDLPHDLVAVAKREGSWARATRGKAAHVLAALQRHPDKTVIFLDVDCAVVDRDKLCALASIPGDVGFYLRTKFKRSGGIRFGTRSGTMVFKPTEGARQFAQIWAQLSASAPLQTVDQDSLAVTLGSTPDCLVSFLDKRYCAVASDKFSDPWILHSCASANVSKPSKVMRLGARAANFLMNARDDAARPRVETAIAMRKGAHAMGARP